MDEVTIDPAEPTRILDRRYRRSDITTQALAFQCAHVQEGLSLRAMIVSDDVGDRWVGSGDKALCRLLSKSAPAISSADEHAAMRLRALQVLQSDLDGSRVTTTKIKVPHQSRYIYVTGVGVNQMRVGGVSTAAEGTKRILGYTGRPQEEDGPDYDAARALQNLVDGAFARLVCADGVTGAVPVGIFGLSDDRVYRDTLNHILAPAIDAIAKSGIVVDDLWRNYRWRSREARVDANIFERRFVTPMREGRSNVRLGNLEVRFFHRHGVFDMPYCPRLTLNWR
jgi:hypothetical protein